MANIRNDSEAVAEAYRQADIIVDDLLPDNSRESREGATFTIANSLLNIWQEQRQKKKGTSDEMDMAVSAQRT